jgi:hypothetical protein
MVLRISRRRRHLAEFEPGPCLPPQVADVPFDGPARRPMPLGHELPPALLGVVTASIPPPSQIRGRARPEAAHGPAAAAARAAGASPEGKRQRAGGGGSINSGEKMRLGFLTLRDQQGQDGACCCSPALWYRSSASTAVPVITSVGAVSCRLAWRRCRRVWSC